MSLLFAWMGVSASFSLPCRGSEGLSSDNLVESALARSAALDKCAGFGFRLGFVIKASFPVFSVALVDVSPPTNMARSCCTLAGTDSDMVATGQVEVRAHLPTSGVNAEHGYKASLPRVIVFCCIQSDSYTTFFWLNRIISNCT